MMQLTRCWLGLLLWLWHAVGAAQAAVEPLVVQQLAPGVWVQFGAQEEWRPSNDGNVANVGFVVGSRCVAVIDSGGSLTVGQRLLAAVARTTPLPVCAVINTHVHPDHLLGNAAFAGLPGPPSFIGHTRLPAALAARERHYLNALQRDFAVAVGPGTIVPPSRTVDKPTELDLGDRMLELHPWPTAHTDNDLTVYDRSTRTLFTGDLLFVGHIPVVDGRLKGWLAVIEELQRLDVGLVVPGHGPASRDWPAPLSPQAAYLRTLLAETRAAIKDGRTIQQAVDGVGRDAARPWLLGDLFHRRNVTTAYAELEWED